MTTTDKTLIGSKSETIEFEVEKGAIRAFAQALGSENPIYLNEEYAKQQGYASLVAPPTFPSTFRLPKPGINVELSRTLHGAQEFLYERPIVAGDVLRCTNQLVDIFEKDGKSGTMTFYILETRGEDLKGNLVFRSKATIIYR
ncbi:MaoC family dehydratase N-terminal domain-containing protein [Alkalihalobacillus deserti]|uniref:MaoC family dehydratase N-terminal domain-containing protein n=1 Tax=Alkalihalobacillus deserti TaxID=2879466 RepID=UPI001D151123|nr:MaoC family dehydratase N-terminal domain-containing protein [Alkalihalobacillus deserti]